MSGEPIETDLTHQKGAAGSHTRGKRQEQTQKGGWSRLAEKNKGGKIHKTNHASEQENKERSSGKALKVKMLTLHRKKKLRKKKGNSEKKPIYGAKEEVMCEKKSNGVHKGN